jgi:N-acetylmuramate 1-kinase
MLDASELSAVVGGFMADVAGGRMSALETMAGDASTRRYHRVHLDGGEVPSAVVMELPDEPLRSDEASKDGTPAELPFLNVQRYLAACRYPVPRVLRADLGRGLIALEDLGDRTFESAVSGRPPEERAPYYRAAIDLIVALQGLARRHRDPGCIAFSRRFDRALLRWELEHFKEWYLEAALGVRLEGAEARAVETAFDWIADELDRAPPTLVHRDFQSRNIMVVGEQPDGLRVIDFQDALMGSQAYDLVALLRDSYVPLAAGEVDALLRHFMAQAHIADAAEFRRLFVLQTLQRKLKDAGRFVFIDRVRKNPSFLRWIPTSLTYVAEALAEAPAELANLRQILLRYVPALHPSTH